MNIEPMPHEFLVWNLQAPVVCMNVDLEFDAWTTSSFNAPVEDIDESWNPIRRRADTF
jgi:hypothetical protein